MFDKYERLIKPQLKNVRKIKGKVKFIRRLPKKRKNIDCEFTTELDYDYSRVQTEEDSGLRFEPDETFELD